MFIVFRCRCGQHLYAREEAKSRTCPCGRRLDLGKVLILARADDAREAGDIVRHLQMDGRQTTGFRPAGQ
ncbi:MAG: hypothetical protein A4E45_00956 [Methanosaeta sp. PtaB.Bin039]|nr:MAG: hypothetical protein A4E45_00956 [Methanosaeta sp. PtaB.Bin039]OPY45058.1 MAG: hypothetical protein A4E47_01179 [Methanosaeta sp. PtaU1.Bin028]HOT06659.1 DUF1922 domain-containing protein [Methanotrichaceae archaeon]HQF16687.1 DUF1922 domain-containing protein [Methanotrichaceae archaeon]HQI91301.1 DUF1922 domain-containing protein [Methanotrichaceae archaeon]